MERSLKPAWNFILASLILHGLYLLAVLLVTATQPFWLPVLLGGQSTGSYVPVLDFVFMGLSFAVHIGLAFLLKHLMNKGRPGLKTAALVIFLLYAVAAPFSSYFIGYASSSFAMLMMQDSSTIAAYAMLNRMISFAGILDTVGMYLMAAGAAMAWYFCWLWERSPLGGENHQPQGNGAEFWHDLSAR